MTAEIPSPTASKRPNRLLLALAALIVIAAAAFFAMKRAAPVPAAADCDKKPPATAFAIEECDQGAAKDKAATGAAARP